MSAYIDGRKTSSSPAGDMGKTKDGSKEKLGDFQQNAKDLINAFMKAVEVPVEDAKHAVEDAAVNVKKPNPGPGNK